MEMTIRAVYEGGVLRPLEPLGLVEGQTVDLTIAPAEPIHPVPRPATAEEEDYRRRVQAARSLDELFAVMATAPAAPDETDDLLKRIDESRRLTGFRMPDPGPAAEGRP